MRILLSTLNELLDPFNCPIWGEIVTREDVQKALKEGRLVDDSNSSDHAGRVAYFVVNKPVKPIQIDVGIDGISNPAWIIDDGNHRLLGSIFAGRKFITADVSGCCNLIKSMFETFKS